MPTRRTNALAALLASSSLLLASAVALPAQSFPPPGGNDQGQGSPATSQAAADTALSPSPRAQPKLARSAQPSPSLQG